MTSQTTKPPSPVQSPPSASIPATPSPVSATVSADTRIDHLLRITDAPAVLLLILGLLAWVTTHVVARLQETATIELTYAVAEVADFRACGWSDEAREHALTLRLRNLSRSSTIGGVTIDTVAMADTHGNANLLSKPLCVIDDPRSFTHTDARDIEGSSTQAAPRRRLSIGSMPPGALARVVVAGTTNIPRIHVMLSVPCAADVQRCRYAAVTMKPAGAWTWLVRNELRIVASSGLAALIALLWSVMRLWRVR